jgi:hypothetical protein
MIHVPILSPLLTYLEFTCLPIYLCILNLFENISIVQTGTGRKPK